VTERRQLRVDPAAAGARLDRWLTTALADLSRARIQHLILGGHVRVEGRMVKPSHRLRGGEHVEVAIPPPPSDELEPEPMALAIVWEDDHVLVVDKPAGLVVHPGAGHRRGTLAAGVLAHAPATARVGGARRPGIVHRLDKDTSGLLVIAKTPEAWEALTRALAARRVTRRYLAVVAGRVEAEAGTIDRPIGRHPRWRQRMAVRPPGQGRPAVTHYRVLERFRRHTWLELRLETGRTHQIRVHMASVGHPVVGDETYGRGRARSPVPLGGLALHAAGLEFAHPVSGERLSFTSPLPARMVRLLEHLRAGGC
jgi:23S rRNA pseudouridine1911/1915/1917 synthase